MALNVDLTLERDNLLELVTDEVERQRRMGAMIRQYRFGFFRLTLTERRLDEGNSLHLWLPELPCDEAPHIHNCRLASRVLVGEVTNVEWSDPTPDSQGDYRHVRTICTDTICQDISSDERVGVDLTSRQAFGPNQPRDHYVVPQGQFHSSVLDGPALTLIRKTNFVDPTAPVDNLLPWDTPPKEEPFDISDLDQSRAWAMLDEALKEL